MEIKTKYNVGDKVWIMRNNKPEKIQISNIEVEVIGDVPVGTCSLSGEYYTKIIYVEVQRSEYNVPGKRHAYSYLIGSKSEEKTVFHLHDKAFVLKS